MQNSLRVLNQTLILAGLVFTSWATLSQPDTQRFDLPSHFKYPNGITHNEDNDIFVGSVVSGDILKISGQREVETFFSGNEEVFAGTSLRYDSETNILWIASPDYLGKKDKTGTVVRRSNRVAAIDVETKSVIRTWIMPNKGFCNDIALDGEGGVYITDSLEDTIHHIESPKSALLAFAQSPLFSPGQLGPAGISLTNSGNLIVGLYSAGHLLEVSSDGNSVDKIELSRTLDNPDGLHVLPNGKLLILEGSPSTGNGKLNLIDLNGEQPYEVITLADNIESPLNLTVINDTAYVTESRIRHLLVNDSILPIPDKFFVREVNLKDIL
ncbi:hypothetical protein BGP78_13760 [Pseudoalteromonas sp. MSK9-3]|nr:hypothetical protein BGP78_13760 [Pseudoalteromonas sp. MSK9-3]